jgi:hypothetical protein
LHGVLWFDSWRELGIFLFTTVSRTALGPTQPPIQWVPGDLSFGKNRPGREADNSPPSGAEVKYAWSYTFTPQYVMAWCLVKYRDFTLLYLCIKRMIKLTVVIVEGYHCYQLRTKCYPLFLSQGLLSTYMKLLVNVGVDFDVIDKLLIRYLRSSVTGEKME